MEKSVLSVTDNQALGEDQVQLADASFVAQCQISSLQDFHPEVMDLSGMRAILGFCDAHRGTKTYEQHYLCSFSIWQKSGFRAQKWRRRSKIERLAELFRTYFDPKFALFNLTR